MIPANTGEIFPKPREQFGRDEVLAFLGAEDEMDEDVRVFVGHVSKISTSRERVSVPAVTSGKVPSLNGTRRSLNSPTRHLHAGLSHVVPSALRRSAERRTIVWTERTPLRDRRPDSALWSKAPAGPGNNVLKIEQTRFLVASRMQPRGARGISVNNEKPLDAIRC